ncbi:MAG: TetR family transcriptional regulator [Haliea sp.]|jgi:AcrR family transcriptional regulator|nr:TetR family transcriptional regulator [Haliea sp.]
MPAATRKRDPQATRQRILEAARDLLAQGDGNFEMAWVAKAAEVSQGLAYHHFGSKEGLLSALVHDFYDRAEDAVLMARFDDYENWEKRERDRVRRYIEFLLGDPLGVTVVTRLAGTPAVAAVEAERWDRLVSEGSRNIAEGQARGVVTASQDSTLLAAMSLGATRSAVAREFAKSKPGKPARLSRDIWAFIRTGLGLEEST